MAHHKVIKGRLYVEDQLRSIGSYESLECLRTCLKEVDENVEAGNWADVGLEMTEDYGSSYMAFMGYRLCTTKETAEFMDAEAKHKKAVEEHERKQYEALKKKFDK